MPSFKIITFFSKSERFLIIFLTISFLIGWSIVYYKRRWQTKENIKYQQQVEIFYKQLQEISAQHKKAIQQKKIKRTQKKVKKYPVIDINLANKQDFEKLPTIGPVLAQRIIDYRNTVGSFKTINELLKVKGIGKKRLSKIRQYLKINN